MSTPFQRRRIFVLAAMLVLGLAVVGTVVWRNARRTSQAAAVQAEQALAQQRALEETAKLDHTRERDPQAGASSIDNALSFSLEAADPYEKDGFTVREDYWGGDLPLKQSKAIVQQLFKGNTYWFWMGTDQAGAKITVHAYDSDGRLVEGEFWQKPHKAGAMVVPTRTGTYYLVVEIEKSPEERTFWALTYGFR